METIRPGAVRKQRVCVCRLTLNSSTMSTFERMTETRRHWLQSAGGGLAALGLAGALDAGERQARGPLQAPKARRVIHLFMNGGPFQADFFDPKPKINEFAGQR